MADLIKSPLRLKDRATLISALIGEYECLCHDDAREDDMTAEEHYQELAQATDDELIEAAFADDQAIWADDPDETPVEGFYNTQCSYCPEEFDPEQIYVRLQDKDPRSSNV